MLSGVCPVRSWMRRLAWLWHSCPMMWRKSSDGSELSISFELVYRFEVFHSVCHHFFIALFWKFFMAEMLTRRGLHLRNTGSSFGLLEGPDAAAFAASSAHSLPSMSLWSGVHTYFTLHFTFNLHSIHPMLPSFRCVLPTPFLYPVIGRYFCSYFRPFSTQLHFTFLTHFSPS